MITDILSTLADVVQKIYVQVQLAEANQAQCQILKQRIEVISKAVQNLGQLKDTDHYRPGSNKFKEV